MYFLKNKNQTAPSTSPYKIIFPLENRTLRYDRKNFSEEKVLKHLSINEFNQVLDEIEREILFFRAFVIYKMVNQFIFFLKI
jgi:hypothetical protein